MNSSCIIFELAKSLLGPGGQQCFIERVSL